jgi:hypothetical protein
MSASAASMGLLNGSTASAGTPDDDCVELAAVTDGARSDFSESKNRKIAGEDLKGSGTTVSAMKDAGGGLWVAHNSNQALERFPHYGLSPGASDEARNGKKTPLCSDSKFVHTGPPEAIQNSGHAEARLLGNFEDGAKGLSLTLSIDWIPTTDPPSKMPCEKCYAMLCAAQKDCEHDISLCDKDGKKQSLEKHCAAGTAGYQSLKKSMGEK